MGTCKEELGGSEYLKEVHSLVKGNSPNLNLELEKAVQDTTLEAIKKGLINSAHDCSEGGLAVALAESCISNKEKMIGAIIDNLSFSARNDVILFGESQSRIILSCLPNSIDKIRDIAKKNKAPFRIIGRTEGENLRILDGKKKLISLSLEKLSKEWFGSLRRQVDSSY